MITLENNVVILSSAPDITKNNIKNGGVKRSTRGVTSSKTFDKLQIIAPSIIQDNRLDKFILNVLFKILFIPIVKSNIARIIQILFERPWNHFNKQVVIKPRIAPIKRETMISIKGMKNAKTFAVPDIDDMFAAIVKQKPKIIKATASSKATTLIRVSVKGPLALYCFTTSRVAAGAVAAAIEARTRENSRPLPKIIQPIKTKILANKDSKIAITIDFVPKTLK